MQRPEFHVPHRVKIVFVWVSIFMTGSLLAYQTNKRTSYWKRHVLNMMQPVQITPAIPMDSSLESLFVNNPPADSKTAPVIIYHFWATWCAPCRVEIPTLNELQALMGKRVKIITIAVDENKEDVLRFFAGVPPRFEVLWDKNQELSAKFGVQKYPESFIYFGSENEMLRISGAREWNSEEALDYLESLQDHKE